MKQKSAPTSSASVPSPQISSRTTRSASEGRNIWDHKVDIRPPAQNSEQKKYWEYRNIYHIPVPQGIEFWEDEDKKRWEMINIGGLDESEANRQIKRAKVQFTRSRQRENREPQIPQRTNIFFILSLICFGLQIAIAVVCIGFCIHQIINNAQTQAGMVFLFLALLPLVGAAGGIFSALLKSPILGLCTAIYNAISATGITVAVINVYSFKIYQPNILTAFIPVGGAVALIQTASFGVVLTIYFDLLASVANYPRRTVLLSSIPNEQMERSHIGLQQERMGMRAREENERELNAKTEDVTRKYKQYLQKKGQVAEKSDKEVRGEGSLEGNVVLKRQIAEPTGSKETNNEPYQNAPDSKNNSAMEVIQHRETASDFGESSKK